MRTRPERDLGYAYLRDIAAPIEVNVQSLLGSLQNQVAIRATVNMARNNYRYAWRKATF